jgi:hypothetical protein
MNVDLLGLSGTELAVSPTSGTGFATPSGMESYSYELNYFCLTRNTNLLTY